MASSLRDEVVKFVDDALGDELCIEDLMLQIACEGELIGQQYLGPGITDILRKDDGPTGMAAEAV